MNTNTTFQTLQAGQALAVPARRFQSLVLVEGEVLVQAPAQWLGGAVISLPPTRVAAPQTLAFEDGARFVALTRSKFAIEESPRPGGWIASAFLRPQAA